MARPLKSPIKANPLRQPGQSVHEQIIDLLFDKFAPIAAAVLLLWFVAGLEWVWMSRGLRPDPIFLTVFAGLITLYGAVRTYPLIRRLKHLRTGYKGERAVGEYLDRFRLLGYRVFHDVPGEGGNIDHVIIATRGIYTIETKTRSKPTKGECKVLYDGDTVSVNRGPGDPGPIIQAKAQAAQLKRLLREITGRRLPVRPVVVFPGWYVEQTEEARSSDVWVLSPKAVYKWIEREPEAVSADAVRHATNQLATHVRKQK